MRCVLTWFDIVLVLIVGGFAFRSMAHGAICEAASLMGWLVAFYVATQFGSMIALWLPNSMTEDAVGIVILFLVLLIGTRLLVWIAGRMLRGIVGIMGLSFFDRLLGGVLGVCKGMLIAMMLVLLAGLTRLPQKAFWQKAMFSPIMVSLAEKALPWLPDYLAKRINF